MENLEKISTKEVSGFMEQWKKHPLSIPILIIVLNLTFFVILIQGTLDEKKIELAYMFCVSSTLIFLIVVVVLVWRKFVFYNATELIILEIERHIRTIQDNLSNVEIGTGAAFDDLQAAPISNEVINNVKRFETLLNLMNNIGYEPAVNDQTIKALAKYYYRDGKNDKALAWLDKAKKTDSECNFIKGLVLWKKGAYEASRDCFGKSEHPRAKYYKFVTLVSAFGGNVSKNNLNEYIVEVSNEKSTLYSDIYAQQNLSVAYEKMALLFPPQGSSLDIGLMQKALQTAENIVRIHNHSFGYFNTSCFICILGANHADLDEERKFDETLYVNLALTNLEKAIAKNSKLLEYFIKDCDFEWLRKKAESECHRLIGKYYEMRASKKS
jgi:tetratricopeptide (TPR) repeat protein